MLEKLREFIKTNKIKITHKNYTIYASIPFNKIQEFTDIVGTDCYEAHGMDVELYKNLIIVDLWDCLSQGHELNKEQILEELS